MSGLAAQVFVPPAFYDPPAFALSVVNSELDSTQSAWTEAVLEEEGLAELAGLLQAVREGRGASPAEIEIQAARHEAKVRRALARGILWDTNGWQPPAQFAHHVTPEMIAALRSQSSSETRIAAGGGSSVVNPIGHRSGQKLEAAGAAGVLTPTSDSVGRGAVGMIRRADAEDVLAGHGWRQTVLPDVLRARGRAGDTPLRSALNTLADPEASLPIKVIALRVLGDQIESIDNLEDFLRAIELITDQFRRDVDPRLQEMALAVLQAMDLHLAVGGLIRFFDIALTRLGVPDRVRILTAENPTLLGKNRSRSFTLSDLDNYDEEIISAYTRLISNFPAASPETSHFTPPDLPPSPYPSVARDAFGWHSKFPPWHSVLPELLEITGNREERVERARAIFADTEKETWQRALALVYYAFSFHPSQFYFIPQEEAQQATTVLLPLMGEENILGPMAVPVYREVVISRINACFARKDPAALDSVIQWGEDRAQALGAAVGQDHRAVQTLRTILRSRMIIRQANKPPAVVPWPTRLGRRLKKVFS